MDNQQQQQGQTISISATNKDPRRNFPQNNWIQGISDYNKLGGAFLWSQGVDYRTEPSQLKLLPQALIEAQSVFVDLGKFGQQVVGRTILLGEAPNLITNGSFETNTTGWTLGADFTRSNGNAYLGTYSIKQVSLANSTAAFTTASGSGIAVGQYTDYQLTFYVNISITSGAPPQLQVQGGSLGGPNLLASPLSLDNTSAQWVPITVQFNSLQYSSIFISIQNQSGALTAYYDFFTLQQINSIATYVIGNQGNIYKRYSNASWVFLGQLPNSHGNGLGYYGEDDFIYVMGDHTVGRYGPVSSGTPKLVNDYLQSAGGIPTNTNSALLIAADSQYFVKTSPNSNVNGITTALSVEAFIKPTSLPAVGNSMTLAGVWKESGNERSWKLDLFGVSGYFGNGQDSSLTISSNTTESPIDSVCSGTAGGNTLFASNASFAVGQKILIMQMQGTNAGIYQITTIQGYNNTTGTITTQDLLLVSYNSSSPNAAQVRVMPQYTNVTINNSITYTAKAWNGSTGGIMAFFCSGTFTNNGTVSANGCGFRGGSPNFAVAGSGEGYAGPSTNTYNRTDNAGGGAAWSDECGSGGGNQTAGQNAIQTKGTQSLGGNAIGTSNLTTMFLGGGGGGGENPAGTAGQPGGGILFVNAVTFVNAGLMEANGNNAIHASSEGAGGAGAGGCILGKSQTFANTGTMEAVGGGGATGANPVNGSSGQGGNGWVAEYYYISQSNTGTITPTEADIQDNTLVTTSTTQVRLGISNNGTNFEYLTQNLQNLMVGQWDRIQVAWQGSNSTAAFYESGVPIGSSTGAITTANSSSTADFAIGANYTSSGYANFLGSEINDVRVWDATVPQSQFVQYNVVNLGGAASGLVGNWFLTNTGTDLVSGGNNVIATGSPTPGYVTDVPYAGATTRGDLDQTGGGTGQTYTLPTTLTENQKQSFVPNYDPQKSLAVTISAKGTGDWTLVVHDGLNELQAQVTVPNAQLPASGNYEFNYPQVFRPVRGATYHFHPYSTVNDGSVVTSASADPTTIQFSTYYQFLVDDSDFHPGMQMGNLMGIGNERYVAVVSAAGGDGIGTYNLQGYNPHRVQLPAGWRVRCFAMWRGYYAIGCWMGNQISDFDQGIVFIWDASSEAYIDFFFIPQGGVNAMWGENGILYILAGRKGQLIEYTGDMMAEYGYDIVNQVKRIPNIEVGAYAEVAPGAMIYYDGLLRIGLAYNSNSEDLIRGIYTWGSRYSQYPKSLSYDYPMPTGNIGTTVTIGLMIPVGGDLLAFYQDGQSYGVANIAETNPPQTFGTVEGLVTDFNAVFKHKELLSVRADHFPLPEGVNVDVKYKINYESSWHSSDITEQTEGDMFTRLPVTVTSGVDGQQVGQYRITQLGLDLFSDGVNTPTVIELSQLTDMLVTETDDSAVES
jgi:hypothetical protein